MKNSWFTYFLHVFGWTFLYILPYLFSFEGLPNFRTIFDLPGDYLHLISFIFLIAFSYINYYILVPRIYFHKKYFLYLVILCILFWLVIYLPVHVLPGYFSYHFAPPGVERPHPLLFGRNYTILVFILSSFFAIAIHTTTYLNTIEKDKLKTELSFLKSQINPHFLFNTLNSIYSLAIQKDDCTGDAIVQLSELMRYITRDANNDLVPLEKEINYVDNYIALQRTRLGETAVINYQVEGNLDGKQIVPLIIITYIENAFKHGVNPNEASEISIRVKIIENDLHLQVSNKKVNSVTEEEGIGLHNTAERLKLLYPSKHELKINDKKESYTVRLQITLT